MRKLIGALLGATMLAGAALSAAPASSATPWETTSRNWKISVNDEGNCRASRHYEDDTFFMLGWRTKANALWIAFGRDTWASKIVEGKTYKVSFETDGRHWNGGDFTGHINDDRDHGWLHSDGTLTWEFVEALAKANTVRFKVDGKSVLTLMLDGSQEALVKTIQCQKSQNGRSPDTRPTPDTRPQAEHRT